MEDILAKSPPNDRFVALALKLAEGFVYFGATGRPTEMSEVDLESCQHKYGNINAETVDLYLKYMQNRHDARLQELVWLFGAENVWVGPSNAVEANDEDFMPEPSFQSFYVRTVQKYNS